jgi:hypothetical protein
MDHECGWSMILIEDMRVLIRKWVYACGDDRPSAHALSWTCRAEHALSPLGNDIGLVDRRDLSFYMVCDAIKLNYETLVTCFYWPMVQGLRWREHILYKCLNYGRLDMLAAFIKDDPMIRTIMQDDPNTCYVNACVSGDVRVLDWLYDTVGHPLQQNGGGLIAKYHALSFAAIESLPNTDNTEVLAWLKTKGGNIPESSFGHLAWDAFRNGHLRQTEWLLKQADMGASILCDMTKLSFVIADGHTDAVRWLAEREPDAFHEKIISPENNGCPNGHPHALHYMGHDYSCLISVCMHKHAVPLLAFLEKSCGLTLTGHTAEALMKSALVSREAMQFMRNHGQPWCADDLVHAIGRVGHDVPVLRWMISEGCPHQFTVDDWGLIVQEWTRDRMFVSSNAWISRVRNVIQFLLYECRIPWAPEAWFAWFTVSRSYRERSGKPDMEVVCSPDMEVVWRLLANEKCAYPACVHVSIGRIPSKDDDKNNPMVSMDEPQRLFRALLDATRDGTTPLRMCTTDCEHSWHIVCPETW